MSNNLFEMMQTMMDATYNDYDVAEYHDAIKCFTFQRLAVLLQWGTLTNGKAFSRTWFTDGELQQACEHQNAEDVKSYIAYMIGLDE